MPQNAVSRLIGKYELLGTHIKCLLLKGISFMQQNGRSNYLIVQCKVILSQCSWSPTDGYDANGDGEYHLL
jgi:hypothetical protein